MVHLLPGLDYAHNNIIIWVDFTNCQLITVIELTTSVSVSQAEIFCCKRSNVFHIISVPSSKIQLIYIPFLYQGCVWCVCVCTSAGTLIRVWLFVTPWTVAHQAPLLMEFSRQECWSGLSFLSPGSLSDPGIKPTFLVYPALVGGFFTSWATREALSGVCVPY